MAFHIWIWNYRSTITILKSYGKVVVLMPKNGTTWTKEEVNYLEENWGSITLGTICKNLNRSKNAIKLKAYRMGLGDPLLHFDGITVSELSKAINVSYSLLRTWIEKYELPAYKKRFVNKHVYVIDYDDFWNWAEENKNMIDFTRFDRYTLGIEPDWVSKKRKIDRLSKKHVPKPHNTPWGSADDKRLKWMLQQHKYTYPEIANDLRRTQGAVKRRIYDLGLGIRPVRLPNHHKYTTEEVEKLVQMVEAGYCFEEIANRLNRSALGVRGKIERMGYYFRNGVPYRKDDKDAI